MIKNKSYKSIIEERNLIEYNYQSLFWSDPKFQDPEKPIVLAFGTSGGKTLTALVWLEMQLRKYPNRKALIVPYATKVLRSNFAEELKDFNSLFKLCVVENRKDIENMSDDCNIIVALPQTLNKSLDLLPEIDYLIVDEAHEWYFAKTYDKLISTLKPKAQLLLTGTPFVFTAKKDDFLFHYVSVEKLMEENKVHSPFIQVVSTSFDLGTKDYTEDYNLITTKNFDYKDNLKMLRKVAKTMMKTISSPAKIFPAFNQSTKNIFSVFGKIDKSIIIANNVNMANDFYKILNDKDLKGQVLVSHSQNDEDSTEFANFKKHDEYKVLIVVNRGRLGFNMPELFNIIDFSFSTNVSVILQILGRVLRKSNLQPDKQKFYYKVASRNTSGYVQDIMTGALSLTMQEYYETYDGNQNAIKIPRISKSRKKTEQSTTNRTSNNINTRSINKFFEMGVLDLDFWKEVKYKQNDDFAITAYTTLEEIRRATFNIDKGKYTKEFYDELVNKHNITTYPQLKEISLKLGHQGLPQKASIEKWDINLIGKVKRKYGRTPKDVMDFIKKHNIKESKDFRGISKGQQNYKYYKKYFESGEITLVIPKSKSGMKVGSKYDEETKKKLSESRKQLWKEGKYNKRKMTLKIKNKNKN